MREPLRGSSRMRKEQNEILRLSRGNLEWLKENYNQIKKKHDNEWVVIQKNEIVATGSTYDQITKNLGSKPYSGFRFNFEKLFYSTRLFLFKFVRMGKVS